MCGDWTNGTNRENAGALGADFSWISYRLGTTGRRRAQILTNLTETLRRSSYARDSQGIRLGLQETELDDLADLCHLARLANVFPTRGSYGTLREILWFGSALAELTGSRSQKEPSTAVRDAALFNLAVSLIDTVVDERPAMVKPLRNALNPTNIYRRLERPNQSPPLSTASPELDELLSLCDYLLARLGRRFSGDQPSLLVIRDLLWRMHLAEFSADSNPLDAKKIPVIFIWVISGDHRESTYQLFLRLSDILSLVDDWQDLTKDILHLRANQFLGLTASKKPAVVTYLLQASWHIIAAEASSPANVSGPRRGSA
jgi:hypothetical protein